MDDKIRLTDLLFYFFLKKITPQATFIEILSSMLVEANLNFENYKST